MSARDLDSDGNLTRAALATARALADHANEDRVSGWIAAWALGQFMREHAQLLLDAYEKHLDGQ